MVVMSRDQAKQRFTENLERALDAAGWIKGRGRRQRVAKEFEVSVETARKWLSGLAIPNQTHIAVIANRLGISPAKLHADVDLGGDGIAEDAFGRKLLTMWQDLTDEVKGQIVAFALINAATKPTGKKVVTHGRGASTGTSLPGK
jgi:hypothetical protein